MSVCMAALWGAGALGAGVFLGAEVVRRDACEGAVWSFVVPDPERHCLRMTSYGIERMHDDSTKCRTDCDRLHHASLSATGGVGRRAQDTGGSSSWLAATTGVINYYPIDDSYECTLISPWSDDPDFSYCGMPQESGEYGQMCVGATYEYGQMCVGATYGKCSIDTNSVNLCSECKYYMEQESP